MSDKAPDLSQRFNTKLSPEEEKRFQAWMAQSKRQGDLADYDLRGAWKDDAKEASNGHLTDKWKKPNHPTFSDESVYNGADGIKGGKWVGSDKAGWQFQASPDNIKNLGPDGLQEYFRRTEPDAKLILPSAPAQPSTTALPSSTAMAILMRAVHPK